MRIALSDGRPLRLSCQRLPSYGYRRLHIVLKREGRKVNHKLAHRLYSEEALGLKRKSHARR